MTRNTRRELTHVPDEHRKRQRPKVSVRNEESKR
jgi:hypothetical protein